MISRTAPNDVPRNAGWEALLQRLNITEVFIAIWEERREQKMKLKEEWEDRRNYRKARNTRDEKEREKAEREMKGI